MDVQIVYVAWSIAGIPANESLIDLIHPSTYVTQKRIERTGHPLTPNRAAQPHKSLVNIQICTGPLKPLLASSTANKPRWHTIGIFKSWSAISQLSVSAPFFIQEFILAYNL